MVWKYQGLRSILRWSRLIKDNMAKATFTFSVKEKEELLRASNVWIIQRFNQFPNAEAFIEGNQDLLSATNKLNKAVPKSIGVKKYKKSQDYVRFLYERFTPTLEDVKGPELDHSMAELEMLPV